MEKTTVTDVGPQNDVAPQSFAPPAPLPPPLPPPASGQQIHRKPLPEKDHPPVTTIATGPVAEHDSNGHSGGKPEVSAYTTEYAHKEHASAAAPPYTASSTYHYDAPLPPLPTSSSSAFHKSPNFISNFVHHTRRRYDRLSRRARYVLLTGLLALVVLVIGLAAGLSVSNRSSRHFNNLPLPSSHGGPYAGDLTYYDPGLGACGVTSTSSDFIVSVSHLLYDAVSTSANPNANPLCGKKIRASRAGKSVDLTVVDRCTGCKPQDLDVTRTVFAGLAEIDQGRVSVSWAWLEDVPSPASSGS